MYLERNKALFDFNAPYPSMHPYELDNGVRAANTINASGPFGPLLVFPSLSLSISRAFDFCKNDIRASHPSTGGLIAEVITLDGHSGIPFPPTVTGDGECATVAGD